MNTKLKKYFIITTLFATLLSGCHNTNEMPNSSLEKSSDETNVIQDSSIKENSTELDTSAKNESNAAILLKVNELYEKGTLEKSVLDLNKKDSLSPDELEFQVKALGKVDWDVFYSKAAELNETIEPDPETGCIMFDYAEFKFLADYPNYNKSDLLSIQKAYTHSDASYSINFAWTLYDLHNKFSTESEFLYENNEAYRNTIDSFTDENGDIIIP